MVTLDSEQVLPSETERLDRFTSHVSQCHASLFSSVFALVQNMADAEDICQAAYVILWQKFDNYVEGTNFYAWALRIAQYEAMNFARRRRRDRNFFCDETLQALAKDQAAAADAASAADLASPHEAKNTKLQSCLKKLPVHQRRLVKLYYEGSRTIADIAGTVSRTENAVRIALCRVRKLLRECMDQASSKGIR